MPTPSLNSENETIATAAGASIQAGHADVVLDPELASSHGLVLSIEHPFMRGKSVYVLEGYHAIHCLLSRLLFLRIHDGLMTVFRKYCVITTWLCTRRPRRPLQPGPLNMTGIVSMPC